MELKEVQDQILAHPLFQRLQTVIENYPGFHDHESVYDHLVKTAKIAQEQMDGHFITNSEAKEKFLELVNQDIYGTKLSTIMLLTALLHDVGKVLLYTENGETKPLRVENPDGTTNMPGHEFWGGRIVVPEILKEVNLSSAAKQIIADVVKVHDAYAGPYFLSKNDWKLSDIICDIKARATGYYEEALFNLYCDCYTSPLFVEEKKMIEKVFNDPTFYNKRKYILPLTEITSH